MTTSAPILGLRVLLVEDEALVALMLQDYLTDLGCVVVAVAADVAQAVAAIQTHSAALDAALLDVNLGGEKVYPVADSLQERGIPFVFSTGYDRAGIASRFAKVEVLSKPYGPEALAATLSIAVTDDHRAI